MAVSYYTLNDYTNSLKEFNNYIIKNPDGPNVSNARENVKILSELLDKNR